MTKGELMINVSRKLRDENIFGVGFRTVNALMSVLPKALEKDGKVCISGFGTFEVQERAARTYHNPHTNEPVEVPARKTIVFRASKSLKEKINKN